MVISCLKHKNSWNIIFNVFLVLLGFVSCIFCRFHFNFFITIFIIPICFLIFSRKNKAYVCLPIIFITLTLGFSISLWTTFHWFDISILIRLALGFFHFIPFLCERLIYQHWFSKRKNLIDICFALTWVISEWIFSLVNPYGNAGSLTYCMVQILPFCQIISILGLHFLTFIIIYFSASISTLFMSSNKIIMFKQIIAPLCLIMSNFIYSGLCLINQPIKNQTIKVMMKDTGFKAYYEDEKLWYEALTNDVHIAKDSKVNLLTYGETSYYFEADQYENIKNQCKEIFNNSELCAVVTFAFFKSNYKISNESWLINGFTNEIVVYQKSHGIPHEGIEEGDGKVKYIDTPYGRIGTVICLDLEFDNFISQVGRNHIDILVAPSADWISMQPNHSITNAFRAIENGVNLIKPTYTGYSIATDYYGNILTNYFNSNSDSTIGVIDVPCKSKFVIYPYLAIVMDYLYIISLCGLLVFYSIKDYFIKTR